MKEKEHRKVPPRIEIPTQRLRYWEVLAPTACSCEQMGSTISLRSNEPKSPVPFEFP